MTRRVILVSDLATWAGTERHVAGLLRCAAARHDLEVTYVTSEDGPVRALAESLGHSTAIVPRPNAAAYVAGIARLFGRLRPDVVHAHSGSAPCLAGRLVGVPRLLWTRHGLPLRAWDAPDGAASSASASALARDAWKSRLAHELLCVAGSDAQWLHRHEQVPLTKLTTIPNGLPNAFEHAGRGATILERDRAREELGIPFDAVALALVGRLASQKAPGRALEVIAGLRRLPGMQNARLYFLGEGPESQPIREQAASLGISDRVHLLGARTGASDFLRGFDLVLLPSTWEGLPYVALESLAAGVPVLCTPVGGLPDLLAFESDLLAPWGVAAWVERAHATLSWTPARRGAYFEAASRQLREFDENEMATQVFARYQAQGQRA